jgi:hypothetical protein
MEQYEVEGLVIVWGQFYLVLLHRQILTWKEGKTEKGKKKGDKIL